MGWLIAGVVAAVVGAVASIGTGIANVASQNQANEQNVELQKTAWDKNSYQSRVEDADKAGISKWLVAGGTPSYSLNTQVKSPDFTNIGSGFGKLADTFTGVVDKQKALAETFNAKAQYENIVAQKDLLDAQTAGQNLKNAMNAWDYMKYQERGIASNDTGFIKDVTAILSSLGVNQPGKHGKVNEGLNWFQKMVDDLKKEQPGFQKDFWNAQEEKGKRKEALKSSEKYGDAWRSDPNSYMPIKVNKHYK